MKSSLPCALLSGMLFGAGLVISGMTDPQRVLGFLDVFGRFDPRLVLVLGGAVFVTLISFRFILRMPKPLMAARFEIPNARAIDMPLMLGAAIFGAGWGIAGYCPGPALAGLAAGNSECILFVIAMLAGSAMHRWVAGRLADRTR